MGYLHLLGLTVPRLVRQTVIASTIQNSLDENRQTEARPAQQAQLQSNAVSSALAEWGGGSQEQTVQQVLAELERDLGVIIAPRHTPQDQDQAAPTLDEEPAGSEADPHAEEGRPNPSTM